MSNPDHGSIAATTIHWYNSKQNTWTIQQNPNSKQWNGWDATNATPITETQHSSSYRPWSKTLCVKNAPFFKWFVDGFTNAAFNECDRHLLAKNGANIAFILEPTSNYISSHCTYRDLFLESSLAASCLTALGLTKGARVVLLGPNTLDQTIWIQGAKRIGCPVSCLPEGVSVETLVSRVCSLGALVVYISIGSSSTLNPKLITALRKMKEVQIVVGGILHTNDFATGGDTATSSIPSTSSIPFIPSIQDRQQTSNPPKGCHDAAVLRQQAFTRLSSSNAATDATITSANTSNAALQSSFERSLKESSDIELIQIIWNSIGAPLPVESNYPLFIAFTSGSTGKPKGLVHSHGTMASICYTLSYSFGVQLPTYISEKETKQERIQQNKTETNTIQPIEPLKKSPTTETTTETTKENISKPNNTTPPPSLPPPSKDIALVVANPAWITGQSYMLSACLTSGITTILLEGSPVAPTPLRFAHVIEKHAVTIFKAGSTFLRQVMADPFAVQTLKTCNLSSLRAASFCAEPVSSTVHLFAMENICKHYINSYWASEHGGIVFSQNYFHFHSPKNSNDKGDAQNTEQNTEQNTITTDVLSADATCKPCPWIDARVMVTNPETGMLRDAINNERGEIVLDMTTAPFPSLARTIWGDKNQFDQGSIHWRGNLNAFINIYFSKKEEKNTEKLLFVQGDWAQKYSNNSFSFHGRSDEVINVGGVRIGTGEIEAALFKHKKIHSTQSPLANCVVVGVSDSIKGDLPVAFVVPLPDRKIDTSTQVELQQLVIESVGILAAPAYFIEVNTLPQTRTGKYLRRLLKDILNGKLNNLQDNALVNPESVIDAQNAVEAYHRQSDITTTNGGREDSGSSGGVGDGIDVCKDEVCQLLVELACQACNWQQDHLNDEQKVQSSLPLNQPLMHIGFDSMRLVLFRDSILRHLPTCVSPPMILFQLFGTKGLESFNILQVTTDITNAIKTAQTTGKLQTKWPSNSNNNTTTNTNTKAKTNSKDADTTPINRNVHDDANNKGWNTATLRSARTRTDIILERDRRKQKNLVDLLPVGGLDACYRGNLIKCQQLFQQENWNPVHAVCQQESSSVHWAAGGGHLDVLTWLLFEMKCDVNAKNKVGRTPLMFAAKYGQTDCVRWLIETGKADIHMHAKDDSDVLAWAVYGCSGTGDLSTLETVASYLTKNDLHHRNKFGCTAIHWAATGGNVLVLKWLYEKGLDFNVVNDAGYGAVSKAAYHRHKEALEWLLVDKNGPQLIWQLHFGLEKNEKVMDDSMRTILSLDVLVEKSGFSSVSEFLKVNAGQCNVDTR